MIELELKEMISAAHALRHYPGACQHIHGHNWTVTVRIQASSLDENGISADYAILRERLISVLNRLDHHLINDLPAFHHINPTSENIAAYLYKEFRQTLSEDLKLLWVKVSETENFSVIYYRPDP